MANLPVSTSERDSRAEERRDQILEAAALAFTRKGYYATTMDDIVAESGLSKGTLYLYFKSKKEILLALCDHFMQSMNAQITANLEGKVSLVARMRAVAEAYVQVYRAKYDEGNQQAVSTARLTAEFWQQATIDPDVRARFIQEYTYFTRFTEDLIQAAIDQGEFRPVDVPALAMVVMSVFDGLSWRWLLNPSDVDWERSIETLFDMMLKGVASH